MLDRNVGVLFSYLLRDLAPQSAARQHVRLIHRGQLLAALAGEVEPQADDALHLAARVGEGILHPDSLLVRASPARTAKVEPAGELPQHQEVRAVHDLAFQRRGVHERGEGLHRPQVGVQAQLFAQAQQAVFGSRFRRPDVPLGTAHRADEDGIRLLAERQRGVRQGRPGGVDGVAPDTPFAHLKRVTVTRRHLLEHPHAPGHYFYANPVAGQNRNVRSHVLLHTCVNWQGNAPRAACSTSQAPFWGFILHTLISNGARRVVPLPAAAPTVAKRPRHHCFLAAQRAGGKPPRYRVCASPSDGSFTHSPRFS